MASNLASKQPLVLLAACGVLMLVGVHLVLAVTLSQSVTSQLLEREGQIRQEFLNAILDAERTSGALFDKSAPSQALQDFGEHVGRLPGIVRANIYSPDGFIRHSTVDNLVGIQFKDNAELARSFTGQVISELTTVHKSDKPEHLALNQLEGEQLIEAYIPVIGRDGKVVAVVEFYRKDPWMVDMVRSIRRNIWIAAGASSLILALSLLLAVKLFRPNRKP